MFFLGILGIFITRKNIIIILVSIELMLLAVNFNFAIFSVLLEDMFGQVFILYTLTLAGAQVAEYHDYNYYCYTYFIVVVTDMC